MLGDRELVRPVDIGVQAADRYRLDIGAAEFFDQHIEVGNGRIGND